MKDLRVVAENWLAAVRFRRRMHWMAQLQSVRVTCASDGRARLNLIVPSVDPEKVFGGIATALRLFEAVAAAVGPDARYRILTMENGRKETHAAALRHYRVAKPSDDYDEANVVAPLRLGDTSRLALCRTDLFVVTHWTTAYTAKGLLREQAQVFGTMPGPLFYVIQDFEPAFNAWSSEYVLAESTYQDGGANVVGIFNTQLLRDYFVRHGYRMEKSYVFEPQLNRRLRALLPSTVHGARRKRQILVYGRPSKPRNGFWLILEALKLWRRQYKQASDWTVLSIGEEHPPADIGSGGLLRSMGKLSLEGYAALLSESAVGLSIMISPHPSYPPLEMAHFGMITLTNRFEAKDLSMVHENIVTLRTCVPEEIAVALADSCESFSRDPSLGERGRPKESSFTADGPEFPFVAEMAEDIRSLWSQLGGLYNSGLGSPTA